MITVLLCVFALVCGLSLAAGFIFGFQSGIKYQAGGKITGKVEILDPIQQTHRRVRELEEEERDQDAVHGHS